MATTPDRGPERWANLRHSIVGALLAAPPARGELRAAIEALAARTWRHPITGAQVSFAYSTVERWLQWMTEFQLGRKRILDTQYAALLHLHGVRRLLTNNVEDFRGFNVFSLVTFSTE